MSRTTFQMACASGMSIGILGDVLSSGTIAKCLALISSALLQKLPYCMLNSCLLLARARIHCLLVPSELQRARRLSLTVPSCLVRSGVGTSTINAKSGEPIRFSISIIVPRMVLHCELLPESRKLVAERPVNCGSAFYRLCWRQILIRTPAAPI